MSCIPDKESKFTDWSESLIDASEKHAVELQLPADKLSEIERLRGESKVCMKNAGRRLTPKSVYR
ncbi:MAG: hypothetical protein LBH85_05110 [Treponema sp.]|nr:hypothetical protein [Treponema sp.]